MAQRSYPRPLGRSEPKKVTLLYDEHKGLNASNRVWGHVIVRYLEDHGT